MVVESVESIPKWKLALAVAAPVAVGMVGVWWYRRRRTVRGAKQPQPSSSKAVTLEDVGAEAGDANLSPLEMAQASKNKGNKYFKGGKYDQAIACYGAAIRICPPEHRQEMATFYQNRAAAFEQLKNHKQVVDDCTQALTFNNKYTKALSRRARAAEQTGDLMQCLEDTTAVCILESFENQQSLLMADRVLKVLGRTKAKNNYKVRGPVEPSCQFTRTYFSTFCNDPIMKTQDARGACKPQVEEKEENIAEKDDEKDFISSVDDVKDNEEIIEKGRDETPEKEKIAIPEIVDAPKVSPFETAVEELAARQYGNIVLLCTKEIEDKDSTQQAEALLLRATFFHLQGEGNKAVEDLDRLLDMPDIDKRIISNALIKRGSLKMQNGEQLLALDDFATAVRKDPENSDIYHHRGQLNLLIDRVEDAVKDFAECVSLSPNFSIAHVQKCYTEYRQAFTQRNPILLQAAMSAFEAALKRFPDCAEGYALYGQALCDQQLYDQADNNYSSALKVEPDNGNIYVHRGLLQLQWKQDVEKATALINEALVVDDKCEFAYETLGTIEVQRGNLERAMELFHKAINLARTEIEMAHLYSLLDAAIAQARVAKNFGIGGGALGTHSM